MACWSLFTMRQSTTIMHHRRTISELFVRHRTIAVFIEFAKQCTDITDLALYLL